MRAQHQAGAVESLTEAWRIADQLGAPPLRDAIVDISRRGGLSLGLDGSGAGGIATGRLAGITTGRLATLTARELEVLELVAQGMS
ncbi:MAG: hypothetical protein ACRDO2_13195, partial [Nocardioidaceae bacterium]